MSAQDVLVLAEIHRGAWADITRELLAAARELAKLTGGQVVALVLGDGVPDPAAALSAADRIIVVNDPSLAAYAPEAYVCGAQAIAIAEQPRAVLIGSTSIGWDVAPLLAGRLKCPLVTGCQSLRCDGDKLLVTASLSGGKMQADVEVGAGLAVLMVLPGVFRATQETGAAQVETRSLPVLGESGFVRFCGWIVPDASDVDITQQDVLVAVGRGIQQRDNVEMAEELAQSLGGAVCASRPVVDAGWLPPTRQVGKSGMTVAPKLYLALGISGAPEHQEGMQGSELIIAINTDAKAPIFDIAHYGAEADALDLLPALVEQLTSRKG